MSDQLAMLPDEPRLGGNQRLVLDVMRERGGITDDEAGALIHSRRGLHPESERCETTWGTCASEGRKVLASLRRHHLCVRRRGGTWEPQGSRPGRAHPPRAAQIDTPGYNELPEGF